MSIDKRILEPLQIAREMGLPSDRRGSFAEAWMEGRVFRLRHEWHQVPVRGRPCWCRRKHPQERSGDVA